MSRSKRTIGPPLPVGLAHHRHQRLASETGSGVRVDVGRQGRVAEHNPDRVQKGTVVQRPDPGRAAL